MATPTFGIHQGTYDAVFQHPIARNLQWRDVKSLLIFVADAVQEDHNGHMKFTRGGKSLRVHPPKQKDFSDIAELMKVRHFLDQPNNPTAEPPAEGEHLLVVIDHRSARVFRNETHGTVPQRIVPLDLDDSHRHLHSVSDESNGQLKPELKSFYEAIARQLRGAEKILILGSATGSSSAMEHLMAELKEHHAEIAKHVMGTVVVNEQHMSNDQLLAAAREFYATHHV